VLRDQGKYEQAGGMYRQELRLCKTVLGPDNPSTLTSRSTSNLALVLRDQGKYEQAEEMYRQALRLSKDMKTKPSMRRNLGR
jgi:tetratricopeptide (TPR) repeat protein